MSSPKSSKRATEAVNAEYKYESPSRALDLIKKAGTVPGSNVVKNTLGTVELYKGSSKQSSPMKTSNLKTSAASDDSDSSSDDSDDEPVVPQSSSAKRASQVSPAKRASQVSPAKRMSQSSSVKRSVAMDSDSSSDSENDADLQKAILLSSASKVKSEARSEKARETNESIREAIRKSSSRESTPIISAMQSKLASKERSLSRSVKNEEINDDILENTSNPSNSLLRRESESIARRKSLLSKEKHLETEREELSEIAKRSSSPSSSPGSSPSKFRSTTGSARRLSNQELVNQRSAEVEARSPSKFRATTGSSRRLTNQELVNQRSAEVNSQSARSPSMKESSVKSMRETVDERIAARNSASVKALSREEREEANTEEALSFKARSLSNKAASLAASSAVSPRESRRLETEARDLSNEAKRLSASSISTRSSASRSNKSSSSLSRREQEDINEEKVIADEARTLSRRASELAREEERLSLKATTSPRESRILEMNARKLSAEARDLNKMSASEVRRSKDLDIEKTVRSIKNEADKIRKETYRLDSSSDEEEKAPVMKYNPRKKISSGKIEGFPADLDAKLMDMNIVVVDTFISNDKKIITLKCFTKYGNYFFLKSDKFGSLSTRSSESTTLSNKNKGTIIPRSMKVSVADCAGKSVCGIVMQCDTEYCFLNRNDHGELDETNYSISSGKSVDEIKFSKTSRVSNKLLSYPIISLSILEENLTNAVDSIKDATFNIHEKIAKYVHKDFEVLSARYNALMERNRVLHGLYDKMYASHAEEVKAGITKLDAFENINPKTEEVQVSMKEVTDYLLLKTETFNTMTNTIEKYINETNNELLLQVTRSSRLHSDSFLLVKEQFDVKISEPLRLAQNWGLPDMFNALTFDQIATKEWYKQEEIDRLSKGNDAEVNMADMMIDLKAVL